MCAFTEKGGHREEAFHKGNPLNHSLSSLISLIRAAVIALLFLMTTAPNAQTLQSEGRCKQDEGGESSEFYFKGRWSLSKTQKGQAGISKKASVIKKVNLHSGDKRERKFNHRHNQGWSPVLGLHATP